MFFICWIIVRYILSVFWCCWLGSRKGILPVKTACVALVLSLELLDVVSYFLKWVTLLSEVCMSILNVSAVTIKLLEICRLKEEHDCQPTSGNYDFYNDITIFLIRKVIWWITNTRWQHSSHYIHLQNWLNWSRCCLVQGPKDACMYAPPGEYDWTTCAHWRCGL